MNLNPTRYNRPRMDLRHTNRVSWGPQSRGMRGRLARRVQSDWP